MSNFNACHLTGGSKMVIFSKFSTLPSAILAKSQSSSFCFVACFKTKYCQNLVFWNSKSHIMWYITNIITIKHVILRTTFLFIKYTYICINPKYEKKKIITKTNIKSDINNNTTNENVPPVQFPLFNFFFIQNNFVLLFS